MPLRGMSNKRFFPTDVGASAGLKTAVASAALAAGLTLGHSASAGMITPDIIFGSGNTNIGFEVSQVDSLELGLRAKLRFGPTGPNDAIGVGIIQDPGTGDYLFDSAISTAPPGAAMWSYDWGINTSWDGNGGDLDDFLFLMDVDADPTANVSFVTYDPLSALSTGAYVGTNATPNGGAAFLPDPSGSLFGNNVAQNSVNYGFIPGLPVGDGEYSIQLRAFEITPEGAVSQQEFASTAINVIVGSAEAEVPAPGPLALLAVGALGLAARRRMRN